MQRMIRLSDGAETTLDIWGESGPWVVGVHGVGSSRRGWARIGAALAESGYRTAAFDQRGHGESAHVGDMTFARSVQDVVDVAAALGEPVRALIGHSWGGACVIGAGRALGQAQRDQVRVVAIDPMLHAERGVWSGSVMPEYEKLLAMATDEREQSIRKRSAALPEVEIEAKLHAGRHIGLGPIRALGTENGIDEGRWTFRHLLDGYPLPLLIAVAGLARSVFLEADRRYALERGGPNVTVAVYEGASHSLQRDAFERFMPDLEAFLAPD